MLALNSSFTSYLVPVPTPLPELEATASRILQFDSKGNCQTPEIAAAIFSVLKSPTSQLATRATIFRNALVCGYERALLDRIEDQYRHFEPELALRTVLQDEGILLEKREGRLWLTRSLGVEEVHSCPPLVLTTLSELGLPTDLVRLIAAKARITPKEKSAGIERYLDRDISALTQQELNDALIAAFKAAKPLPEGQKRLEISDFEFSVPALERCTVPPWIKLTECRLVSGTLQFSTGLVTTLHEDAIAQAIGPKAIALAGVPASVAIASGGGTATAISARSKAKAYGSGSTAFAKAPFSTAYAFDRAQAKALASSTSAFASLGGWAIATVAHSKAFITSLGEKSDQESIAIASSKFAKAYVYGDRGIGIAMGGAEVLGYGRFAEIHAYDHSKATGMQDEVTVVKHHEQATVSGVGVEHIVDCSRSWYGQSKFLPIDQIVHKLTTTVLSLSNIKSPDQ